MPSDTPQSSAEFLRSQILSAENRNGKLLQRQDVQFCGHTVWAWELTGSQRARVEQSRLVQTQGKAMPQVDLTHFRASAVLYGTRQGGQDGAARIFGDGDEQYLNQLPASELDRVAEIVCRLSGLSGDAAEDAKKNSPATVSAAPASASPSGLAGPASPGGSTESPLAS